MRSKLLLFSICIVFSGSIFPGNIWAENISQEQLIKEREAVCSFLIVNYGINDKTVLQAIGKVDRRRFLPEEFQNIAYEDKRLYIGSGPGQYITRVRILAETLQLLKLRGNERVLEIGTGSGYQTAVIAEVVKEVYTIEIAEDLAEKAEALFEKLGYSNIKVKHGDGFLGWEEFSPYDIILIGASMDDEIAPILIDQLAENGRIVIPLLVGKDEKVILNTMKEVNGEIINEYIDEVKDEAGV